MLHSNSTTMGHNGTIILKEMTETVQVGSPTCIDILLLVWGSGLIFKGKANLSMFVA